MGMHSNRIGNDPFPLCEQCSEPRPLVEYRFPERKKDNHVFRWTWCRKCRAIYGTKESPRVRLRTAPKLEPVLSAEDVEAIRLAREEKRRRGIPVYGEDP